MTKILFVIGILHKIILIVVYDVDNFVDMWISNLVKMEYCTKLLCQICAY